MAWFVTPVAWLVMVTAALGTTAPLGSVTVPVMPALACAKATFAEDSARNKVERTNPVRAKLRRLLQTCDVRITILLKNNNLLLLHQMGRAMGAPVEFPGLTYKIAFYCGGIVPNGGQYRKFIPPLSRRILRRLQSPVFRNPRHLVPPSAGYPDVWHELAGV